MIELNRIIDDDIYSALGEARKLAKKKTTTVIGDFSTKIRFNFNGDVVRSKGLDEETFRGDRHSFLCS